MENKQFLNSSDLDVLIDIFIGDIIEDLVPYVYFKGLLLNLQNKPFYANGYFILEESEWGYSSFMSDDGTPKEACFIRALKGTKYSNNDRLLFHTYKLKTTCELEEKLYCYDEFKDLIDSYNIPLPRDINYLKKQLSSNGLELIKQKNHLTLDEIAELATNIHSIGQNQVVSSMIKMAHPSKNEYKQRLYDDIRGANQDGYKLHTIELWCFNNDEFGEKSSQIYKNSIYIERNVEIDFQHTIISKQEFVRWCEYQDVNIGLIYEPKNFDEPIEALKDEKETLKQQQRPPQQLPPSVSNKNNNEKIKQLNTKIKALTDEVELLQGNSFSIMTSKLKAILATQNEYWINYDNKNLPTQQEISNFIAEKLNLTVTAKGTNRTADELAKAIQPDEIKRK
ncbi:hypothetical protein [Colwellia sp. BRX8-9]|uniref:hypothetical protein n=1 Tax=Colwellia sp. BRX8-9 TaxID=2759831 RepID=UPI0015F49D30|nr:hypothetical protein [Colwellia sp. BRX8-9]MBA6347529.1 hypothetical protein [Colwellia sp. BRX8-9]